LARIPEIGDDDLELLMAPPAETPIEVTNQILDIVGLMEPRLSRLEGQGEAVSEHWLQ
jgi:hypothetical protein